LLVLKKIGPGGQVGYEAARDEAIERAAIVVDGVTTTPELRCHTRRIGYATVERRFTTVASKPVAKKARPSKSKRLAARKAESGGKNI
jgi:hypothetical protein